MTMAIMAVDNLVQVVVKIAVPVTVMVVLVVVGVHRANICKMTCLKGV